MPTHCSRHPYWLAIAALAFLVAGPLSAAPPGHVVVIGVDGLSPEGIRTADTPNMDQLIESGAHTFKARAVMPTSSSPNWASMIMGAGPEQHGVTSNAWQPHKYATEPTVKGPGGIFPTVFSVLREQRPDAVTACFYDWGGFGRLVEPDIPDVLKNTPGAKKTTNAAVKYIKKAEPLFLFVHLDHVDHAGHDKGYGSPEYYASVEEADRYIGDIVKALKKAAIFEDTILIVTSDHGGKGTGHGGTSMGELEIPWIVHGPGVQAGKTITAPVNTYDTAATVAHVLGLTPPEAWIARPVLSAFSLVPVAQTN